MVTELDMQLALYSHTNKDGKWNKNKGENRNLFIDFMSEMSEIRLSMDALVTGLVDVTIKLESIRKEIKGDDHYA